METVIRVSVIYFFVMLFFRVLGKREVGQLSPFDLVLLLLIPDISQQGMIRDDFSITTALIGLSTLLSLVFLNSLLTYRSKRLESLIEGEPSILFHHGHYQYKAMDLERVSPSEIISAMHKAGYASLDQIKWVILETDGELSFIPMRPLREEKGAPNNPEKHRAAT